MRVVKKNVYYCDYCNKRSLSAGHARNHEIGCTLNPNRRCGMCGGCIVPVQTEQFAKYLEPAPSGIESEWLPAPKHPMRRVIEGQYDAFIGEVEQVAGACPACMLAIIRQLHILRIPWEYKAAKDAWWATINEENFRKEHSCYEF